MAEINNVIAEASQDLQTIEDFVNLPAGSDVRPRLLPSVNVGTLAGTRDAIFEAGGLPATPFKTKALMTASVLIDGKYAMVTDDTVNNGLYVKTAGAWVKSNYDPTLQANDYTDDAIRERVYNNSSNKYVFAFADENGLIGLGIDRNGNLVSPTVDAIESRLTTIEQNPVSGGDRQPIELKKTDYMHVFSYGQSLSRGYNSLPVINTTQPYNNVTFSSGVLPLNSDTHDFTDFKPLVESTGSAVAVEGETPVSGMLNGFVRRRVANGDAANNWQMVGSASGRSSYGISMLSKGTTEYTGMIAQVQAAYNVSQAKGKTYSVWSLAWTQGERDYYDDTTQAAYLAALLKLNTDFTADVKAITGQSFAPQFIMYQTAAQRWYERNEMTIALAQLQAANDVENIVMACPIYNLPHGGDFLHLTNNSSEQLGRYYAKALDYYVKTGKKWQPLQPVNIVKQGKIIDIEFNKSGLVIDTTLVTATHNKGFDLWSGSTLLDTIVSVTVSDSNRVRIVLSAIPVAGAKLSYGKGRTGDPAASGNTTGARGNLRDNEGVIDNYTDSSGVTRFMHNWSVMFEQTL